MSFDFIKFYNSTNTPAASSTPNSENKTQSSCQTSASASKLSLFVHDEFTGDDVETDTCYILFNTETLKSIFALVKCPNCSLPVTFTRNTRKKMGLCHTFDAVCTNEHCDWIDSFSTSKTVKSENRTTSGQKAFDVNVRTVITFRELGRGFSAIETFCRCMNMPPPMNQSGYDKTVTNLYPCYKAAANDSMLQAANEAHKNTEEEIADVTASFDGSWQKRGFSSLNGLVTAICDGKCVDVEVMTKVCKACQYWEKHKNTTAYDDFQTEHNCPVNHAGSAGLMEAEGVKKIFKRSVNMNKLRYTTYRGDGDTKAFLAAKSVDAYPGIEIVKSHCVSHVQKRARNRLNKLRESWKSKLLDGEKRKGIGGTGRLTDRVIHTLQNYYGMSIRQNKGDLYGMKKAVAAILYHCSENENDEARHKFCPRNENGWCKFQRDKITGESTYKKPSINIPENISELIKPIFSHKDLGADDLLEKCLDCETQNNNEAINALIWKRCPKDVFVGKMTLDIGVSSAIINWNDGDAGLLRLFSKASIVPGKYTNAGFQAADQARIREMNYKCSDPVKNKRKRMRGARKGYEDKHKDKEGDVYVSGEF